MNEIANIYGIDTKKVKEWLKRNGMLILIVFIIAFAFGYTRAQAEMEMDCNGCYSNFGSYECSKYISNS